MAGQADLLVVVAEDLEGVEKMLAGRVCVMDDVVHPVAPESLED